MNEFEMKQNATELSNQVTYLEIRSDADSEKVAEILRSIKEQRKNIVQYWSKAKETSRSAYKAILAKEKEMLKVCDEAEKTLKTKLLDYKKSRQEQEIKAQIEAEKLAQNEAENLLKEAIDSEENGDLAAAEMKIMQAEMVSNLSQNTNSAGFKIKGISSQKRWSCRVTDNELVPAFFYGIEIREINIKKILELRKQEPDIKIPGIEFYQDETIVIR